MTDPIPRLYLVDGSGYIFRAYFAMPPLHSRAGLPTHAILGFTNLMLKFIRRHRPDYVAVALDAGRENFRHAMFPAYKGTRAEAPADLIPQLPYVRRVLDAMGLPVFELAGYEADDIIATLCRRFSGAGCQRIVVSSDKDLMQLACDGVRIYDGSKERWIDDDAIAERFGVAAHRIVEVMGLMGDTVDNIPGVRGIGRKTAVALIRRFETLENLYDRLHEVEVSGLRGAFRIRNMLDQGRSGAFLSRELATVNADVPLDPALQELQFKGIDRTALGALCAELNFDGLARLLEHEP